MDDRHMDRQLNVHTGGEQMGFHASMHEHRFEVTPYAWLQALFQHHPLAGAGRLVDFGSGKGRLNFYAHQLFGTPSSGVEVDPSLHEAALRNLKNLKGNPHIEFCNGYAQDYRIRSDDRWFYFFNPFSDPVFMKVVGRILRSVAEYPREVDIILFYPSIEYIDFLERRTAFELFKEIPLPDNAGDPREKFLVYRLPLWD
ncbi:SAM-dependent methyltransferase [Planococcus dechangensis]|uniref:SAM-dependent methyltransferase n=1 Tax=Planococcus dechangensis TaxID=1176255 RepID=A0ABV9MFN1_9BACL